MNQIVYDMCRQAASEGKTITYSDVGSRIGLDMEMPPDRDQIRDLLDEVSRHEHEQGGRCCPLSSYTRAMTTCPARGSSGWHKHSVSSTE